MHPSSFELTGSTMGTQWSLSYYPSIETELVDPIIIRSKIEARLLYLNDILSNYVDHSEISQLNRLPKGVLTSVSSELIEVFAVAERVTELTNGAFDISISPLVALWGFGPNLPRFNVPPTQEISASQSLVGIDSITIDLVNHTILKSKDRSFDLSSLGKGYAVDVISYDIKNLGIDNFLFEIGGEIFASGFSPKGDLWKIAVKSPFPNSSDISEILRLSQVAVATSGSYQNFFEYEDIRYSHIINPITGFPVESDLVSATVISDSAIMADAFATALMLIGSKEAMILANRADLAVYLIKRDGDEYIELRSKKLSNYL